MTIDMTKKVWRANVGSMYWFLDTSFEPQCTNECGDSTDDDNFDCGNYFKNKAVAMAAARFIKGYLDR